MSRPTPRQNRMAQMSMQEELIQKKKQEILEKQKAVALRKLMTTTPTTSTNVALDNADASSPSVPTEPIVASTSDNVITFRNNFNNDGSFLEKFKKLTQAANALDDLSQINGNESSKCLEKTYECGRGTPIDCPPATTNVIDNDDNAHDDDADAGDCSKVLSDQKPTRTELIASTAYPTTVEQLVEMVAISGDSLEEHLRSRKNELQPQLWFLFDTNSVAYQAYRVQLKLKMASQDKYDPEEALSATIPANTVPELKLERSTTPSRVVTPAMPLSSFLNDDEDENTEDSDTEYRREAKERNLKNMKSRLDCPYDKDSDSSSSDQAETKYEGSRYNHNNFPGHNNKRKEVDSDSSTVKIRKKSRWGEKVEGSLQAAGPSSSRPGGSKSKAMPMLSSLARTEPGLVKLVMESYGTLDISEEKWVMAEEQYKVKMLYEDMLAKRTELERLAKAGKFKYDYDSDEDTKGGTWEHKLRQAEMNATKAWSDTISANTSTRHHIGDFLPPEELKRFMEQYEKKKRGETTTAADDYQDHKLTEDNKGFQMLQKLGWKEGEGLGAAGSGIVTPINKSSQRETNQGLGANANAVPEEDDNEYDAYRKRMMLAYRFRPNPLNNPRRAYY